MITSRQVWDAIPSNGFIAKYIRWAAKWIDSAEPFHLVSALALLSQTFPENFGLPTGSYPLRANFYGLVVGPSGSGGKSEAVNAAASILELALPDCYVQDRPASTAAAIALLNEQGKNQLIFYPEFGMFLGESEQGQFRSIRDTYTDFYDCRIQSRVRREEVTGGKGKWKKKPVDPRWSLLGGSAPGFLEDYTHPRDWTAGFTARIYVINSDRREVVRPRMGPEKDQERDRVVGLLKKLALVSNPTDPTENWLSPPRECIGIDDDALDRFFAHLKEIQVRAKKVPEYARAALDRAKGHVLKLAMLLAWDTGAGRSGDPWRLSLDDMEHAIALDELRIQSVTEIVENIVTDPDGRNERKFLRALEGGESLPFGEIIRKAQLGAKRGAEARESLKLKGLIEEDPEGVRDQHQSTFYKLPQSNVIPFRREKWPDVFEEEKKANPEDVISIDFGGGDKDAD